MKRLVLSGGKLFSAIMSALFVFIAGWVLYLQASMNFWGPDSLGLEQFIYVMLLWPIVYTLINHKNFNKERRKWWLYSEVEMKEVKEAVIPVRKTPTPEELQLKWEEEFFEKEKSRKQIEKYRMKDLGLKWHAIPTLVWIGVIIYAIYQKNSDTEINAYVMMAGIALFISSLTLLNIEGGWAKRRKAKLKLKNSIDSYDLFEYDYDYTYTDSHDEFVFYRIAKFITYCGNFVAIAFGCLLIFSWLSSIAINPTTIIIILLIIIIIKLGDLKRE